MGLSPLLIVLIGTSLVAASAAVTGVFTFLRKRSLVGDAIAHAVLPGVCIGFMAVGTKDPLFLTTGAFVTAWLSIYAVDLIRRHTPVKEDGAIGIVLTVFFALGILLLTSIQSSGNAEQSGLEHVLFGSAASMTENDLYVFGGTALAVIAVTFLYFKEFELISFDRSFALVTGIPVKLVETVLTTITVLSVVIGIQTVGIVLMAAMLITPAAAGRYWTQSIRTMMFLAVLVSVLSGVAGVLVSMLGSGMPTGPWIVIIATGIAIGSIFFAPERGLLARWQRVKTNKALIRNENILKTFYRLGEDKRDFATARSLTDIMSFRQMDTGQLDAGLKDLEAKGYLTSNSSQWMLTQKGIDRGRRVVRLHRLWETYLTQYLRIAPDHVHDDAETIEHIITPELERELDALLDGATTDPHNSPIPRAN